MGGLNDDRLRRTSVLAFNSNKMRCLTFNIFRLQDSLHHLSGGLGTLVSVLEKSGHNFDLLKKASFLQLGEEFNEEGFQLCKAKGLDYQSSIFVG